MLTRLYCDNYKCLVNFEFRPKPLQLLIGRNGSGKSTVFEALALLRDFAARGESCEDRLVGQTKTRWQDVEQQRFELEVIGNSGIYNYELLVDDLDEHPRVRREFVSFDGKPLFRLEEGLLHLHNDQFQDRVQFPFGGRRSGLAIVEPRPENKKLSWLKNWLARVLYVQIDPKRMIARAEKEDPDPTLNLSNFAQWYRHLRLSRSRHIEDIRKSLQQVINGFESLEFRDVGVNVKQLEAEIRAGEIGKSKVFQYSFEEFSDGQKCLVGLYTLLHYSLNHGVTICIDEPDNFVALAEIQPWLSQLRDMQESGSQILLASHHPELLNELATREGVILDRVDGRQTLVRPWAPPNDTTLTPAEIVARGWEEHG